MSNATSSSAWRLYVIVDPAAARGRDLARIAECAIRGGADVIQLRDKTGSARQVLETAARLLAVTRPASIPLIINDRIDIALASGADGVHVGQDDLPVSVARRILGPDRIIGKSTHSLAQALEADREGADYLAVGPLYTTPTKPDSQSVGLGVIAQVRAKIHTPLVAIGGIEARTLPEVLQAGATCVAVVRAVCGADDPEEAARTLTRMLTQFHRVPT